ncbi:class I SAM-dependent methyltransferase [Blastococcus sp. URHD0036]|uniref:class I SAM-dependent methyltransferase n=1 Tax=Blastococcus sp. URHD0036 TaxID=1380356 RepID=UPI00068C55F1|nr:class I SAM-dependent methyltransferase [Blastococcus sp. URHD0036]
MLSIVVWKLRRIAQLLGSARRDRGIRGLRNELLRIVRLAAGIPLALTREYVFDVRRGVRTRGFLRNADDITPLSVGRDAQYYQPIGLRPLRDLVRTIPLSPATTSFVDLGAGRGRAVLLAAELGFATVLGVELDDRLAHEGQQNIGRWRHSRVGAGRESQDVRIMHGDAARASLPDGPLVVAMFNPFGATTLRLVVDRLLREQRTGDLYLAYIHPVHAVVLEENPQLTLHAAADDWQVFHFRPVRDEVRAGAATAG